MPAFRSVLEAVADVWEHRREEATAQSARIVEAIDRTGRLAASAEPLTDEILTQASQALRRAFDPAWGGFGGAPKFPQPMTLEFLLRMHLRGPGRPGHGAGDAREDGGGRDLRPGRRRVPPLLDRRAVAGPPLREDALRQRAADPSVRPRLAGRRRSPPQGRDRDERLPAPRAPPSGRRPLLLPGRRQRGRGGGSSSSGPGTSVGAGGGPWPSRSGPRRKGTGRARTSCGARCRPARLAGELGRDPGELERDLEAARGRLFELRARRVRPATDDKVLAAWNADGDHRARRGRAGVRPARLRRGRGAGGGLRARAPARRGRTAPAFVAGRPDRGGPRSPTTTR